MTAMMTILGPLLMGGAFGFLLQRGKITSCNVIETTSDCATLRC